MNNIHMSEESFPGLYRAADQASLRAQNRYFTGLASYLVLLVCAAAVSYLWPTSGCGSLASAMLFLVTLAILGALKYFRPDEIWYNGRAVAESVKTRSWRWMMRAEPYEDSNLDLVSRKFIGDLKAILKQNRSLSKVVQYSEVIGEPITDVMRQVRELPFVDRVSIYKSERVDDQSKWYSLKSVTNKRWALRWFVVSVFLHFLAIAFLLYRIKHPTTDLPVELISTVIGAVLTWLQAKKHNELNASYTLAAQEIVLIKGEALSVNSEKALSDFVLDSEAAFSREHTQWCARKLE